MASPRASLDELPLWPAPQHGGFARLFLLPRLFSLQAPAVPCAPSRELAGAGRQREVSSRAGSFLSPHPRSWGHGDRQSQHKGLGTHSLPPPPSFGLHQRERAEETGLLLLTSDLRQRPCWECGWGSPGSRRRSTLTSTRLQKVHPAAATLPLLLSLKNEIEGTPHQPAFPRPDGKDERSRSYLIRLFLGNKPRRRTRGPPQRAAWPPAAARRVAPPPALGGHPCGAEPAPPSTAPSDRVTSCPPDTGALADSRALSSKEKYSPGAHPSVLQRAEAARVPQPTPRAIDQGLLNPYPASTFYPSARLRSQNTSSFCHFSSKLLIRSFSRICSG